MIARRISYITLSQGVRIRDEMSGRMEGYLFIVGDGPVGSNVGTNGGKLKRTFTDKTAIPKDTATALAQIVVHVMALIVIDIRVPVIQGYKESKRVWGRRRGGEGAARNR